MCPLLPFFFGGGGLIFSSCVSACACHHGCRFWSSHISGSAVSCGAGCARASFPEGLTRKPFSTTELGPARGCNLRSPRHAAAGCCSASGPSAWWCIPSGCVLTCPPPHPVLLLCVQLSRNLSCVGVCPRFQPVHSYFWRLAIFLDLRCAIGVARVGTTASVAFPISPPCSNHGFASDLPCGSAHFEYITWALLYSPFPALAPG